MPIRGLTTGVPQFPRIGILRKGAPKPENGKRPGRDLEHFRYVSDTNPESVQAFYDAFGKQPNHLTVLMPYSTVDENFEAWQEQWTASRLQHRCDGEHVELYYDEQRGTYVHPQEPKPCPGGCKPVGRLSVIIPALIKAGHVGTVTLKTTSKHDIMNIHGGLTAYYQMRGDLRGIEFVLYRYPEQVTTPDGPRREKWLVGLKAHHEWVTAQLQAMQHRALTTEAPALPSGEVIDGETGEIIDHDDTPDFQGHLPTTTRETGPTKEINPQPANGGKFWATAHQRIAYFNAPKHAEHAAGLLGLSYPQTKDEAAAALMVLEEYASLRADGVEQDDAVFATLNSATEEEE